MTGQTSNNDLLNRALIALAILETMVAVSCIMLIVIVPTILAVQGVRKHCTYSCSRSVSDTKVETYKYNFYCDTEN